MYETIISLTNLSLYYIIEKDGYRKRKEYTIRAKICFYVLKPMFSTHATSHLETSELKALARSNTSRTNHHRNQIRNKKKEKERNKYKFNDLIINIEKDG